MQNRRRFLKRGASLGAFCVLSIGGLLRPSDAYALWPKHHFVETAFDDCLKRLFGERKLEDSDRIRIKAPKTAENGSNVPVTISGKLDNIEKIYLLADKNPVPLVAEFDLTPGVAMYIKARIKMAESSDIVVIADDGERLLMKRRSVEVSVGGCGG